ncbi:MAG TPA: hypothetical protein VN922_15310, partial [Bacteroidia bacterium]|nr:hypothetical protein [Bacteroidia bacterium]
CLSLSSTGFDSPFVSVNSVSASAFSIDSDASLTFGLEFSISSGDKTPLSSDSSSRSGSFIHRSLGFDSENSFGDVGTAGDGELE